METIEEKIERFRNYNSTMIDAAVVESNLRYEGLPSKLILCSIMDSLSIAAFPDNKKDNRIRFTRTIKEHSKWQDHDRVSLLQIREELNSMYNVPPEFLEFQSWLEEICNKKFATSNSLIKNNLPLGHDPLFEEIKLKWPKQKSDQLEILNKKSLEQFTHRNLLWMYRNRLTHEFRLPGKGSQSSFRMEYEPYYQEVAYITEFNTTEGLKFKGHWELIYPTGFFKNITSNCIESICSEYSEKQVSPFSEYREGSSWLLGVSDQLTPSRKTGSDLYP